MFFYGFSMVFKPFWEDPIHIQDVEPVKVIFAPPKRSTPWFSAGLGALKNKQRKSNDQRKAAPRKIGEKNFTIQVGKT